MLYDCITSYFKNKSLLVKFNNSFYTTRGPIDLNLFTKPTQVFVYDLPVIPSFFSVERYSIVDNFGYSRVQNVTIHCFESLDRIICSESPSRFEQI